MRTSGRRWWRVPTAFAIIAIVCSLGAAASAQVPPPVVSPPVAPPVAPPIEVPLPGAPPEGSEPLICEVYPGTPGCPDTPPAPSPTVVPPPGAPGGPIPTEPGFIADWNAVLATDAPLIVRTNQFFEGEGGFVHVGTETTSPDVDTAAVSHIVFWYAPTADRIDGEWQTIMIKGDMEFQARFSVSDTCVRVHNSFTPATSPTVCETFVAEPDHAVGFYASQEWRVGAPSDNIQFALFGSWTGTECSGPWHDGSTLSYTGTPSNHSFFDLDDPFEWIGPGIFGGSATSNNYSQLAQFTNGLVNELAVLTCTFTPTVPEVPYTPPTYPTPTAPPEVEPPEPETTPTVEAPPVTIPDPEAPEPAPEDDPGGLFDFLFGWLLDLFTWLIDTLWEMITWIVTTLWDALAWLANQLWSMFAWLVERLWSMFGWLVGELANLASWFWALLAQFLSWIGGLLYQLWILLYEFVSVTLPNFLFWLINSIVAAFTALFEWLLNGIAELLQWLLTELLNGLALLLAWLVDMINDVVTVTVVLLVPEEDPEAPPHPTPDAPPVPEPPPLPAPPTVCVGTCTEPPPVPVPLPPTPPPLDGGGCGPSVYVPSPVDRTFYAPTPPESGCPGNGTSGGEGDGSRTSYDDQAGDLVGYREGLRAFAILMLWFAFIVRLALALPWSGVEGRMIQPMEG